MTDHSTEPDVSDTAGGLAIVLSLLFLVIVGGWAINGLAADWQLQSAESGDVLEITGFDMTWDFGQEAHIDVRINQPETGEQVSAIIILDDSGNQVWAQQVESGQTKIELYPQGFETGEYELVAVHGGKVDFFTHSGGTVIERISFTVG